MAVKVSPALEVTAGQWHKAGSVVHHPGCCWVTRTSLFSAGTVGEFRKGGNQLQNYLHPKWLKFFKSLGFSHLKNSLIWNDSFQNVVRGSKAIAIYIKIKRKFFFEAETSNGICLSSEFFFAFQSRELVGTWLKSVWMLCFQGSVCSIAVSKLLYA